MKNHEDNIFPTFYQKNKEDVDTALLVGGYILVGIFSVYFDVPSFGIVGIVIGGVIYSIRIYDKLQYRRGEYPNEIRFPTTNDEFYKITHLLLGSVIMILAIVWLIRMEEFTIDSIVLLVLGALLLTNGLLYLPGGKLAADERVVTLRGSSEGIHLSDIESIQISGGKVTIRGSQQDRIMLDGLELTNEWFTDIKAFLEPYVDPERIEIVRDDSVKKGA